MATTFDTRLNRDVTDTIADTDYVAVTVAPGTNNPKIQYATGSTLKAYAGGVQGDISPDSVTVESANTQASPALSFGDGDTGFYELVDDALRLSIGGTGAWTFTSTVMGTANSGRAALRNSAPSATNPNIVPNQGDTNTGIGQPAADAVNMVAGGLNCIEARETGSAAQVGFYGTTPVSQQTGVAVSAAGIHAALVNLGLITA